MVTEDEMIRVLHVDEEAGFTEMTAEFLKRADDRLTVETASSAEEGLATIADVTIDCIVSDYDMSGQDGIEFLEAVREDYPDLPFILYTGKGSEEVASEAISAGVTDYLQKETGTGHYSVLANRIGNVVSARRSARDADRRQHRLEQILTAVPSCVVQIDYDGQFVFANERAEEVLGLEPEGVAERTYNDPEWDITDLDGNPIPDEELPFRQVRDSGEPIYGFRHTVEWPDGTRKVLLVNGAPLFDDQGNVESTVFVLTDITERQERDRELRTAKSQLEAALTEKERQNRAFGEFLDIVTDSTLSFDQQMTEILDLGVDFLDLDIGILSNIDRPDYTVEHVVTPDESIEQGTVLDFRDTFCSLVYEADGPVAFHNPEDGDVKDHPCYQDLGLEAYLGEPLIVDDERYGTLNFSSPSSREEPFTTGEKAFIRTLSEWLNKELSRQKREQELRETSRRLDLALEATDTGVWEWNMETDEVVWSKPLERLLGIEPGTFDGTFEAHAEYLHPDDIATVEQSIEQALDGDGEFHAEFRMHREDGEQIWVEGRGELLTEDGPRRMIGTTTDITDRKESELALARREVLDPSVELEFHSNQIAQTVLKQTEGGLDISFDGVVPKSDETQLLYMTVRGSTAKEIQAILDTMPTVGETRLLSTVGDSARYEVSVETGSIATVFAAFDGELQSLVIEDGTCKLVGEFPETVDPDAVIRAVRETYPDIELVSQRRIVTPGYLRSMIEDDLTERQRTVLGMAHFAGYFEQPRQSTGEELADRLGITRQAFNVHLRKAQATLLHDLFEEAIELPT